MNGQFIQKSRLNIRC